MKFCISYKNRQSVIKQHKICSFFKKLNKKADHFNIHTKDNVFFVLFHSFQFVHSVLSRVGFLFLLLFGPAPVRGGASLESSPEPISKGSWFCLPLSGTVEKSSSRECIGRPYTLLCRSAMSFRMSAISRSRKSKDPGGPCV